MSCRVSNPSKMAIFWSKMNINRAGYIFRLDFSWMKWRKILDFSRCAASFAVDGRRKLVLTGRRIQFLGFYLGLLWPRLCLSPCWDCWRVELLGFKVDFQNLFEHRNLGPKFGLCGVVDLVVGYLWWCYGMEERRGDRRHSLVFQWLVSSFCC